MRLRDVAAIAGGDICTAARAVTDDGRTVFVKRLPHAPSGFFTAEVAGLDFLRVRGGPPLPDVLAVADDELVLEWVEPGPPTAAAADALGRGLARMHATAPETFGRDANGFIGTLPLDNRPVATWAEFYVERRIGPFLGGLNRAQRDVVEKLCADIRAVAGPERAPARIHGDLWNGNVLWGADGRCRVVDAAAAHGGHPETDLAMLALFGAPYVDRIVAAYEEVGDLTPGWRERMPLHQLHPLLVHTELFGGGYAARAAGAAEAALRLR